MYSIHYALPYPARGGAGGRKRKTLARNQQLESVLVEDVDLDIIALADEENEFTAKAEQAIFERQFFGPAQEQFYQGQSIPAPCGSVQFGGGFLADLNPVAFSG